MRRGRRGLAWALALGLGAGLRAAPPSLEVRIEEVDPSRFPRLTVLAQVVDQAGYTLRNLERRHLALFEDDFLLDLREVVLDKDPVSVVFALDSSGTMTPAADRLRAASAALLRLLDPRDAAAVLEFSGEPRFLSRFGEDRSRAIRALNALVPYGPTALYDAAYRALLELGPRKGKRNVVLLSDGKDQNKSDSGPGSRHTVAEVLALAKKLEVPIHVVAIGRHAMKKELAYLAKQTGGGAYHAPRPEHLEDLYRRVVARLKGRLRMVVNTRKPTLDASVRRLSLRVRAGEAFGQDEATYHSPGRWVVDVGPVGYRNGPIDPATRAVQLRDAELAELEPGDRQGLIRYLQAVFEVPVPGTLQ